jgi:hypothetical protein
MAVLTPGDEIFGNILSTLASRLDMVDFQYFSAVAVLTGILVPFQDLASEFLPFSMATAAIPGSGVEGRTAFRVYLGDVVVGVDVWVGIVACSITLERQITHPI